MYTDTHCHVLPSVYYDVEELINNLKTNNIKRIIVNGYNYKTNKEVIELCSKYANVYGALGIHPDNIDEDIAKDLEFINNNINNPKIIAIGEIGLDYYHNKENKYDQIELLSKLLQIAQQNKLPVIIHNREATNDLIELLKKYKTKGIIHCFSGSIETAKTYIKMGYKLGINGILTFKNSKLKENIKEIGIKNILLETDSPYISPEPIRGTINEPLNINIISKKLIEILNISESELSQQLEENFNEIFDINT